MIDDSIAAIPVQTIYYKNNYKYRLDREYQCYIPIQPNHILIGVDEYVVLHPSGLMVFKKGYSWDGATGVKDTKTVLRASLVHDGLYQFFREGKLSTSYKEDVDRLFKEHCLEDKMSKFRAWYMSVGQDKFAKSATLAKNDRIVLEAP